MNNKHLLGFAIGMIGLATVLFKLSRSHEPEPTATPQSVVSRTTSERIANDDSPSSNPKVEAYPLTSIAPPPREIPDGTTLIRASWGSGNGQLGRTRPEEANPEGPAAFTTDSDGNLIVLDGVNGRINRYKPDGSLLDSLRSPVVMPQEVVAGSDGSLLVMDRLVDKTVAVLDKSGTVKGRLPIVGEGLKQGGSATGLFRDKSGVYVENEHSQLLRIGDENGKLDPKRPTLDGRPTKDGRSLISAHLIDRSSGTFFVRVVDRESGDLRLQRQFAVPVPLLEIVMLDSDAIGNIYAAVHVGREESPGQMLDESLQVLCLSPDANVLGTATLSPSKMPEEVFRTLSVGGDGKILYMQATESGMTITEHFCT